MVRTAIVAWALLGALGVPALAAQNGERLFQTKGCVACHVLKGNPAAVGTLGPDLSGYFKAKPPHDAHQLAAFIQDPQVSKPGGVMPALDLTREEAAALATYVLTPHKPVASRSPAS